MTALIGTGATKRFCREPRNIHPTGVPISASF